MLGEKKQLKFHPFSKSEKKEKELVFTESEENLRKLKDEYIDEKFIDADEDKEKRVIKDIHWSDDKRLNCSQYTAVTVTYDRDFQTKELELVLSEEAYCINEYLMEIVNILQL